MTRELKLALIVGFALVLVVTVLISDHLSRARHVPLAPAREDAAFALGPAIEPATIAPPASLSRTLQPAPREESAYAVNEEPSILEEPAPAPSGDSFSDLINEARRMGMNVLRGPDGQWHITPVAQHETVRTQPDSAPRQDPRPLPPILPEPRPQVEPDRQHSIVAGDSLFALSQRYYGDGKYWRQLAAYNKDRVGDGSVLRVGVKIAIPTFEKLTGRPPEPRPAPGLADAKPRSAPAEAARPADPPRTYTVQKGDTLGQISQRMLGTARRVPEIIRLNGIEDQDTVRIGMVLKLPPR